MKKILVKDKMRRIFAIFFVMLASALFIHSEVFAANGSGSASGEFGPHGCYGENASNLLQNVRTCNDGTGGASWHIFSIKNLPIEFSKTKIFEPEYRERPILNTENLPALKNFDSSKITKQCENADYYLAYVYDGWWGFKDSKNKIHNNVFSYWGPIPWKTQYMKNDKGVKHYPVYNNKQPYLAFDEDSTTYSTYTGVVNGYTGYHFTEDVSIYKAIIYPQADMTGETFYIQESSDGTNYSNISSALDSLTVASHTILCNPSNIKKAYCRITNTTRNKTYGGYSMYTIQFYGRKDV